MFLIVGFFMLGVVSAADVNYALASEGGTLTSLSFNPKWGSVSGGSLLDGNPGGYIGYTSNWGTATFSVGFSESVSLNRVYIPLGGWGSNGFLTSYYVRLYFVDGSVELIIANSGSKLQPGSLLAEGDWSDVTSVSVSLAGNADFYAIGIEAMGPGLIPVPDPATGSYTCSNPNQTIMKLSNATNAHGALWNDTVYTWDICYDQIFGFTYDGEDPHNCDSNNVLWLSDIGNAHGAEFTSVDYATEICYGDLICDVMEAGDEDCESGGNLTVSLSADSNAHLSDASDLVNYPQQICCRTGVIIPVIPVALVYWQDTNGENITEADVGDIVYMVAPGMASHDFEIWEIDTFLPDFIFAEDEEIRIGSDNISNGKAIDGIADWVGTWKITEDDISSGDLDHFRFVIDGEMSGDLNINNVPNNGPLGIKLLSPVCGTDYDEGEVINVVVNATDEDNIIIGNITVDGVFIRNFTNGLTDFDYTSTTTGNVQFVAQGYSEAGNIRRGISNIMVLDVVGGSYIEGEKYLSACILKPEDFQEIDTSEVEFNASTTRGIEIEGGIARELIPGVYNFSWKWTFMPNDPPLVIDFGRTINRKAFEFNINFPTAGGNWAELDVGL